MRWIILALTSVIILVQPASAQSFLGDQVELLQPNLILSVVGTPEAGVPLCDSSMEESFVCRGLPTDLARGNSHPDGVGTDALGGLYSVSVSVTTQGALCNLAGIPAVIFEVNRQNGGTTEPILRIPRCVDIQPAQSIGQWTVLAGISVDSVNGNLFLALVSDVFTYGCCDQAQYGVLKVSGLPTVLDIILSYQPPSTLSFNVPVRPEGLVGADSFSVYSGNVGTASDLSQAVPLQCTVPAGRPPVAGEHLSVPDNLPAPQPGDARYYLAAVSYQGQTRAGRQAVTGILQGRNASALTGCH